MHNHNIVPIFTSINSINNLSSGPRMPSGAGNWSLTAKYRQLPFTSKCSMIARRVQTHKPDRTMHHPFSSAVSIAFAGVTILFPFSQLRALRNQWQTKTRQTWPRPLATGNTQEQVCSPVLLRKSKWQQQST
jgi:hypothetical protein